jgi:hypothetical protein
LTAAPALGAARNPSAAFSELTFLLFFSYLCSLSRAAPGVKQRNKSLIFCVPQYAGTPMPSSIFVAVLRFIQIAP